MSDDGGRSQQSGVSGLSGQSGLTGISGVGGPHRGSDHGSNAGEDTYVKTLQRRRAQYEETMFAAFHAISTGRWENDYRIAFFVVLMDSLQVALFLIDPVFDWDINWENIAWRWVRRVHLQNQPTVMSYNAWVAVFLTFIALFSLMIALTFYVGKISKGGKQVALHTGRLLRLLTAALITTYYISGLNMMMVALYCNWGVLGNDDAVLLAFYPPRQCTSFPHIILGAAALVFVPLWIAFSSVFFVCYTSPSPLNKEPLGQASSTFNLRQFRTRTLMALCFFTLAPGGQLKLLSLIFLLLTLSMAVDAFQYAPYYSRWMNLYCAASRGAFFFGALTLVIHVHNPAKWRRRDTQALFGGSAAFAVLCGAAQHYLLLKAEAIGRSFSRATEAAIAADPHVGPSAIASTIEFDYDSAEQVEQAMRILRTEIPEPSPQMRATFETIFLTATRQFPDQPLLFLLMGNYKMFVCKDVHSAQSNAERAALLTCSMVDRSMLMRLKMEIAARTVTEGNGSENTMDLAQYVEFQNTYAAVTKVHRAAYRAERKFWRLITMARVSFGMLSSALDSIASSAAKADRAYRAALEKYPSNVVIMRAYARFLEDCMNNPGLAQRYFAEAEKVEESNAADAENDADGVNDKRDAVIVISSTGIIRIANKNAHEMFGHKHEALIGKNVSTLMPPPYAAQHNSYLKRFAQTQRPTILNIRQKLEGKHKLGHTFPLSLMVSKVESGGEVSYMGIVTPRVEDGVAVGVTSQGLIRSVNPAFRELFGFSEGEILGRPFSEILKGVDPKDVIKLIQQVAKGRGGEEVERSFEARHMSGTIFPISVALSIDRSAGAKPAQRPTNAKGEKQSVTAVSILAKITALSDNVGVITIDDQGNIKSTNAFISKIFGYPMDLLASMNIAGLMPRPYSKFHASYLKRLRDGGGGKVVNDNRGRMVTGLHKDGRIFTIRLEVHEITEPGSNKRLFSGKITMPNSEAVDRRNTKIRVSIEDGSIVKVTESCEDLFGFKPDDLAGCAIDQFLAHIEGASSERPVLELVNALPPHQRQPDGEDLSALDSAAAGPMDGPPPYIRMRVLNKEGQFVAVSVEAEPTLEPRVKDLLVWSTPALEGVICISASGVMTAVTFGIQCLFGYRRSELVGTNVNVLMPLETARVHDMFLGRFTDARQRKAVGTRRIVEARHRDGTIIRVALEVSEAEKNQPGKPAFSARVVVAGDEPVSELPREVAEYKEDSSKPFVHLVPGSAPLQAAAAAAAAADSLGNAHPPSKEQSEGSQAEADTGSSGRDDHSAAAAAAAASDGQQAQPGPRRTEAALETLHEDSEDAPQGAAAAPQAGAVPAAPDAILSTFGTGRKGVPAGLRSPSPVQYGFLPPPSPGPADASMVEINDLGSSRPPTSMSARPMRHASEAKPFDAQDPIEPFYPSLDLASARSAPVGNPAGFFTAATAAAAAAAAAESAAATAAAVAAEAPPPALAAAAGSGPGPVTEAYEGDARRGPESLSSGAGLPSTSYGPGPITEGFDAAAFGNGQQQPPAPQWARAAPSPVASSPAASDAQWTGRAAPPPAWAVAGLPPFTGYVGGRSPTEGAPAADVPGVPTREAFMAADGGRGRGPPSLSGGLSPNPGATTPSGWPRGMPFPPQNIPAHLLAPPRPAARHSSQLLAQEAAKQRPPAWAQPPRPAGAMSPNSVGSSPAGGTPAVHPYPGGLTPLTQRGVPVEGMGSGPAYPGRPLPLPMSALPPRPPSQLQGPSRQGSQTLPPPYQFPPSMQQQRSSPDVFAALRKAPSPSAVEALYAPGPVLPAVVTGYATNTRPSETARRVALEDDAPAFKGDQAGRSQGDLFKSQMSAGAVSRGTLGNTEGEEGSSMSAESGDDAADGERPAGAGHGRSSGEQVAAHHHDHHKKKNAGPLMDRFVTDSVMVAEQVASMRENSARAAESEAFPPRGGGGHAPKFGVSLRASDSSAGANRESSHLDANAFASPKGRPSTGAAAHDFPIALHSPHAAAGPLALPHAPPPPLDDPLLPPLHSAEEPEPVKEENHLEADFARERRFRLISRLLSSPKMREAVDTLKKHSKLITLLAIVAYVVSIVLISVMIDNHKATMEDLAAGGRLQIAVSRGVINAIVIEQLARGTLIAGETIPASVSALTSLYEELDTYTKQLYLGDAQRASDDAIRRLFDEELSEQSWVVTPGNGTNTGFYQRTNRSAWDVSRKYLNDMQLVAFEPQNRTDMEWSAGYRYLINNGPTALNPQFYSISIEYARIGVAYLGEMKAVEAGLLAVDGVIFIACIVYFTYLLHRVSEERMTLFLVFFAVPKNVVFKLASKSTKIGDEGGDDSDDDDDWGAKMQAFQKAEEEREAKKAAVKQSEIAAGGAVPTSTLSGPLSGIKLLEGPLSNRGSLESATGPGNSNANGKSSFDRVRSALSKPTDKDRKKGAGGGVAWLPGSFDEARTSEGGQEPALTNRGQRIRRRVSFLNSLSRRVTHRIGRVFHKHGPHQDGDDADDGDDAGKESKMRDERDEARKRQMALSKRGAMRKRMSKIGSANYSALGPMIIAAAMAIVGFGVSYMLINNATPTVNTELKAARTLCATARYQSENEVKLCRGMKRSAEATDAAESALAHRTRFFALTLVTRPLNASVESTLALLVKATNDLELNYNATVYGDASQGTKEILTTSADFDAILFKPGCLQKDSARCYTMVHPWYPYTGYGLDTLVRKYIEELRLLMLDPPALLTVNNSHFNFVWATGKGDLHYGLQKLLLVAEESTLTDSEEAKTLQIAMLVAAFFLNVFFFTQFFLPWLSRTLIESKRVAQLLSELPPEMNIGDVIRETMLDEHLAAGTPADGADVKGGKTS